MKKYITIKTVDKIEVEDCSYSLLESFNIDEQEDDYSYIDESIYENNKISINVLKNIIDLLEREDANFLQIIHPIDHGGYIFEGLKIVVNNEEEVIPVIKQNLEKNINFFENKKTNVLSNLDNINNEIQKLKMELNQL